MEDSTATGRLFRSLRADGPLAADAIIALDLDDAVRLRSVHLADPVPGTTTPPPSPTPFESDGEAESGIAAIGVADIRVAAGVVADAGMPVDAEPSAESTAEATAESDAGIPVDVDPDFAHLFADEPPQPEHLDAPPVEGAATGVPGITADSGGSRAASREAHRRLTTGTPAWVAAAMVGGVTVLIGIADVIVTGDIGWLTGIALVLVSCYAAATVRPQDAYWAIVSPPLAFLLTTITVGQATVSGGGFWVRQGLLIPFTLGRAALWIVAATAASAAIVVVRRRRALAR